jgi:hypothetical protein
MKSILLASFICVALLCGNTYAQTNAPGASTKTTKTTKMKEFILFVRVPVTYTREQAEAVSPEWALVTDKWKADGIFVTSFVCPGDSYVISGAEKSVKKETVITDNLRVVSNIILLAEHLEDAVELAKACPVLNYNGTIEVRAVQPRVLKPGNK